MRVLIILLLASIHQDTTDYLKGEWTLQSYDVIDKIRSSPAYLYGDSNARQAIEKSFQEILTKGKYNFTTDTLYYTDLDGGTIIYRNARWHVNGQVLYIDEIRRPFKREAFIHYISRDSLVLSPIINGQTGTSKMTFTKRTSE
jgi:hypothetical protein